MTDPRHDDTPDPRLRAALEHAPDHALRPAPELREAVRRQALEAARQATRRERAPPWWRRPWVGGPGLLGMAASLATVGLGLSLAWRLSVEVEPLPAPTATRHAGTEIAEQKAAPPPAVAGSAVPLPAPTVTVPEVTVERRAEAPRRAAAAAAPQAPAPAAAPAPVAAPPPEATPRITPSQATSPAPAGLAERSTGAAAERQPPAAFAPPAPRAAQDAAAPATLAAKAVPKPRQETAPTAWPAPLARWAQALFDAGEGVDQPAGWQQLQPAQAAGTPARRRDWWLALLSRTSGRWQAEAAADPPRTRWQARGPDGMVLTLWLDANHVWLQADGSTWRAARPAGLASIPGE